MPPHGLITEGGYRPLPPFWGGIGEGGGRGSQAAATPLKPHKNKLTPAQPPQNIPPPNPQISIPSPQKNNHGEGGNQF